MFDLKKKCCCSDNQYNFDVPWENVWHSRFHLKVSKTCYNMLIYWKIKYDSIKKMFTLSWKISQIREKKTKPHLQQLLHYMKYAIFFFSCLPYQKPACTRYHPIRVTVIFISDNRCYKQSVLELCRVELILLNDLCLQRYKETQKAHHIIDHKNSQSYDILMSSKAD